METLTTFGTATADVSPGTLDRPGHEVGLAPTRACVYHSEYMNC